MSNWAQLWFILKSCVCSLKWAQVELKNSIFSGDISLKSCNGICHWSEKNLNFLSSYLLNELSNWAQLGLILKICVCSLKWAQVELNCLICLEDRSFRSNLLLMQKVDYGLYQQPILTWSCIKIRSAKHLNSFWTLIVNPNKVQNRRKNQSNLNFNPTSCYDTCVHKRLCLSIRWSIHWSVHRGDWVQKWRSECFEYSY